MPIYKLIDELIFPPVSEAEDGIVAIGGDLSPERLMLAYQSGIFPWYSEGDPIVWWSPDPRCVLLPEKLHISRSMQRVLSKKLFEITFNQDFHGVIENCQRIFRKGQEGTWITEEMKEAYIRLHELGHAHSIEVWKDKELVGGMYGIDLGTVFCGESMFSKVSNASKAGFSWFVEQYKKRGGLLIDCQVHSNHLESLGAEHIPREAFINMLDNPNI